MFISFVLALFFLTEFKHFVIKYLLILSHATGTQHILFLFSIEHCLSFKMFACEEYNFLYRTTYQLWSTGHQGGVHNSYLAFIVNTGFVGFGFFILFWVNAFRKVKNLFFLFPFLATIAFSAMFESWLFSSLSAFHIMFLVTVSQLLADRYLPVHRLRQ